jgi:hypothetical protein
VDLEQGPLSLVSTTEELLGKKSSCLDIRKYGCGIPTCWPRGTLYPQRLPLNSPTSGGRSVGIVRSQTETTELYIYNDVPKKLRWTNQKEEHDNFTP